MSNELAMTKKDTVDVVVQKVKEFQEKGELALPSNFSADNALKSAWLTLQGLTNKNGAPVLESCTKDSIANSLLDMVVQGLTPSKKQGYFIAYGRNLVFQRSYFGTMAVTKRVSGAKDIVAQIVYADDEFEYEIEAGRKKVTVHKQKLSNVNKDKIIGAYCTIIFKDSEFTDVMSFDEIKQSWAMSKSKQSSTHADFTQEMAKKTVINRTCKMYLNSSDDSSLIMHHAQRSDEEIDEEELIKEEVTENANSEYIDVEYEEVEDQQEPSIEEMEPINKDEKNVIDVPDF